MRRDRRNPASDFSYADCRRRPTYSQTRRCSSSARIGARTTCRRRCRCRGRRPRGRWARRSRPPIACPLPYRAPSESPASRIASTLRLLASVGLQLFVPEGHGFEHQIEVRPEEVDRAAAKVVAVDRVADERLVGIKPRRDAVGLRQPGVEVEAPLLQFVAQRQVELVSQLSVAQARARRRRRER